MSLETILVTGGAGYIGSHVAVELLRAGFAVVIVDNLVNSEVSSVARISDICGKRPSFEHADIQDELAIDGIFSRYKFDAVIHLAALKSVAESVAEPDRYYANNVGGSLVLVNAMRRFNVEKMVFSSSATVYGSQATVPVLESAVTCPVSPYGHSKLMCEQIFNDIAESSRGWRNVILRYFNPVGAHPSGLLGERLSDRPDNLFPHLGRVALGLDPYLKVFGGDYPTSDGTGVRDYVHVQDVAEGHLLALRYLLWGGGGATVNLGRGRGLSVLEAIESFSKSVGRPILYEVVGRRLGDVAQSFADPSLAHRCFGWSATRGISEMCDDSWRWYSRNYVANNGS
jgi:UDP-glucose 4-epimerase